MNRKKVNTKWILLAAAVLLVSLCSCAKKTSLMAATGANAKQGRAIDAILEEVGISYVLVSEAVDNAPDMTFSENHIIYNIVDTDANYYYLVLDNKKEVAAVLDDDENILYTPPA